MNTIERVKEWVESNCEFDRDSNCHTDTVSQYRLLEYLDALPADKVRELCQLVEKLLGSRIGIDDPAYWGNWRLTTEKQIVNLIKALFPEGVSNDE